VGTVVRGATLVELEPASVETADLRIAGGVIVARGASVAAEVGDEIVDGAGKYVLPGFVSAHHHLAATLLRGAPRVLKGFAGERAVRERLAQTMTMEDAEVAATAGALEGLLSGTTTVFDTHLASANVTGALARVARGLSVVGVRAVVAQQVGPSVDAAIAECLAAASAASGRLRAAVAVGELGGLSDDALRAVRRAMSDAKLPALVALAEDPEEEARSVKAYGRPAIERLLEAELVGEDTVISHGVHLSWPELTSLIARGAWMVHAPRTNMASQTGHATALKFGVRATLGTACMPLDVLAEAQAAALRAADSGQPIDVLRFLANGHRLATRVFGQPVGPLREGAVADLVVVDYQPPTALDASTLAAHVQSGLSARHVESVMVDGQWRLWKRRPLSVDEREVTRTARGVAQAAWLRMVPEQPSEPAVTAAPA
jgi:cytosine/adenosine deaminase-related metal-dependent hydrolase